jgi:hypothetical protein
MLKIGANTLTWRLRMSFKSRLFPAAFTLALVSVLPLVSVAQAQVVSRSRSIIVVPSATLPALAQQPGIAFQLYSGSGDGTCYLYVEQKEGKQLAILNVTDPANIKVAGTVSLAIPSPFDFVGALGQSAVLIQFRNHEMALLDLRNPEAPVLRSENTLGKFGTAESLGDSGLLIGTQQRFAAPAIPRDYQVVDASDPSYPSLLFTVKQVSAKIARDETGTLFLLGSDGLTIIRRPRIEQSYKLAESYSD